MCTNLRTSFHQLPLNLLHSQLPFDEATTVRNYALKHFSSGSVLIPYKFFCSQTKSAKAKTAASKQLTKPSYITSCDCLCCLSYDNDPEIRCGYDVTFKLVGNDRIIIIGMIGIFRGLGDNLESRTRVPRGIYCPASPERP